MYSKYTCASKLHLWIQIIFMHPNMDPNYIYASKLHLRIQIMLIACKYNSIQCDSIHAAYPALSPSLPSLRGGRDDSPLSRALSRLCRSLTASRALRILPSRRPPWPPRPRPAPRSVAAGRQWESDLRTSTPRTLPPPASRRREAVGEAATDELRASSPRTRRYVPPCGQ